MKRGESQRRRRNRGRREDTQDPAQNPDVASLANQAPERTEGQDAPDLVTQAPLASAALQEAANEVPAPAPTPESRSESPTAETTAASHQTPVTDTAEKEIPAALEPTEPTQPEARPAAAPASTDGLTSDGRACNDPRVESKPIIELNIETSHTPLFGASVAPPAKGSETNAARAGNDPRGPKDDTEMAQAANNS